MRPFARCFHNIPTLKYLSIEDCSVDGGLTLTNDAFEGSDNIQKLQLSKMDIESLQEDLFVKMESLAVLMLSHNKINTINSSSSTVRNLLDKLERLDLSNNPFECTCDLFWFLTWTKNNEHKVMNFDSYYCSSPANLRNTRLRDLNLTPEDCLARPLANAVWTTFVISFLIIFFSVSISLLHRFRWRLRVWLFHFHVWLRPIPPRKTICRDNFVFDLFVSHNACDTEWVAKVLIPRLEKDSHPPFKLCVYSRNWLAGGTIADCIVESVAVSRKTLFLVTNAFARSEWCQYELAMAQHHFIETDKDNLIMAVMEDIKPINMNPRLQLLLKSKVYLRWTDDQIGQDLFWKRLEQMLRAEGRSLVEATPSSREIEEFLISE